MEHSIAARYAARSAASFVRPSTRARERRLGLGSRGSFRATSARQTVLHRPHASVLARLRGGYRAFRAARPAQPSDGRPRPVVTMHWARSGRTGANHRSSAATAPWRA